MEIYITAAVTLLVCLINNWYQQRRADQEQDKQLIQVKDEVNKNIAVLTVKMDNLSEKVTKHNQLVERVYKLESDMALVKR